MDDLHASEKLRSGLSAVTSAIKTVRVRLDRLRFGTPKASIDTGGLGYNQTEGAGELAPEFCRRCGKRLTRTIAGSHTVTCRCGWHDDSRERAEAKARNRSVSSRLMVAAAFMAGVYLHAASWGSHSLRIPFLRVAQVTGLMTVQGYQSLARVCRDVGRNACAENALQRAYERSGREDLLEELATFQLRLNETNLSAQNFDKYVRAGGHRPEALVRYANLLERYGREKQAFALYEKAATEPQDKLPVQAVGAMIRILIKQKEYDQAALKLRDFYASAGNARGYLNAEATQLTSLIRARTIVRAEAARELRARAIMREVASTRR